MLALPIRVVGDIVGLQPLDELGVDAEGVLAGLEGLLHRVVLRPAAHL